MPVRLPESSCSMQQRDAWRWDHRTHWNSSVSPTTHCRSSYSETAFCNLEGNIPDNGNLALQRNEIQSPRFGLCWIYNEYFLPFLGVEPMMSLLVIGVLNHGFIYINWLKQFMQFYLTILYDYIIESSIIIEQHYKLF